MTDRARITDLAVAGYAAVAGAALLFPGRPSSWPLLAAGHLALLALALLMASLRGAVRRPRWATILADWYPLLLLPLLYAELALLNTAVWGGRYFDHLILAAEETLFGGQPSMTLAAAAPWLPLSEILHAAYISYYPIIYLPPLALYLMGRKREYRAMLRPLVVAFLLHYVLFVYFPVQGPRYLFPAPGGAIADGSVYRLTHLILEGGSSRGAAFPSSHMAVAVVQTVGAFRFLPRAAPLILVATIGLGVGAVYGGFHYATDMIVGAAAGLAAALWFLRRDRRRGMV